MNKGPSAIDIQTLRTQIATLEQLLEVCKKASLEQADKLYGETAERRRIQEELGFRNIILSTQLETSLDGILVADINGAVIFYNQRFLDLWGLSPEAIKSKPHIEAMKSVMHKLVDPDGFLARLVHLYEHREEKSRDEIFFKDGRIIDRYTSPMFGADGAYYGRVWYLRDVTEYVTAARVLRENEEKFRAITDTAQDAVIMVNAEGNILFWNKAAERIFGYAVAEAVGKSMHLLIVPKRFQEEHLKGFSRFIETGDGPLIGKTAEVLSSRSDGTEFPIELSLSAVKLKDRWCATGIVRDISERKQSEKHLLRLNSELKALYEVSQAISRTLEMEQFLPEVLQTLAATNIFSFETKIALFLAEEEKLRLAAFIGLSETAPEPCAEIQPGKCLCGMALATGEVVVSENSMKDKRHSVYHPDGIPHGHIVVPLKAGSKIVGLLTFYIQADAEVKESQIRLLSSLGTSIGIAVSNARLYEETKSFSLHDPLTGLANRRFLQIQMDKALELAKRYEEGLSVVMLDIDYFKKYNDTRGHPEGDRLLVNLAHILLRVVRKADYVFRYGGEEFFIILPETDSSMAREAAERLRKAVAEETGVTISLGVASLTGFSLQKDELIARADEALYCAKKNGRNRVEVATDQETGA